MKLDPRNLSPEQRGLALVLNVTIVPWARLDAAPIWGKAMAAMVAILQVATFPATLWNGLLGDVFSGIFVLAAIASLYDWWVGRTAAKHRGDFDSGAAKWGFQAKLANLTQLLLIRALEFWLGAASIVETRGFVAAALAMALFAEEMASAHATRVKAGAKPMPLIGRVIGWMDQISRGLLPVDDERKPRRRREDREITVQMRQMDDPDES